MGEAGLLQWVLKGGTRTQPSRYRNRRLIRCEAAGADEVDANSVGPSEAVASGAVGVDGWLW